MPDKAIIDAFFDEATFTVTYLVSDLVQRRAAVIDPVLDYDHRSGKASTVMRVPPSRATARSIVFSSSRTFPGQS